MKAIKINNLTVKLNGGEALNKISLTLDEGKFLGIVLTATAIFLIGLFFKRRK